MQKAGHKAGWASVPKPKFKERFPADATRVGETKAQKLQPARSRMVTVAGRALARTLSPRQGPPPEPAPRGPALGNLCSGSCLCRRGRQPGSQGRPLHRALGALWNALYQSHSTQE